MTTKVKIELLEDHTPVVVEVINTGSAGERIRHIAILRNKGARVEEYIHSAQTVRIRERTTEEEHNG